MYPNLASVTGIVIAGALHMRAISLFYQNDWRGYWLQRGIIETASKMLLPATIVALTGNLLGLYAFAVGATVGAASLAAHIALVIVSSFPSRRDRPR